MKLGLFQPLVLWPFPDERARELFAEARNIFVVEHNQGMLIEKIKALASPRAKIIGINRYDGSTVRAEEVLAVIRRTVR